MSDSDGLSNKLVMWIVAGAVVLVALALLGAIQLAGSGKIDYDKSDRALYCVHSDQCERPNNGKPIAETQNTLSNLAYIFFGVCVLVRAWRPGAPALSRTGPFMFGLSLCFLGLCSGYYHGTLNYDGTTDVSGALRLVDLTNGQCRPAPRHSDNPQLWDIVGVYMSMIILFLCGIDRLLAKKLSAASAGNKALALAIGVAVPVIAMVACLALGKHGGKFAGFGLLIILAILSAFVLAARVAGKNDLAWLTWSIWGVCLLVIAYLSALMKTDLGWDSTWVFLVMAAFLAAVLAANLTLAVNPVPWPEVIALLTLFLLGGAPRVLDGYTLDETLHQLFRNDLCSPDALVQPHALWHIISAMALMLAFDLFEKSRQAADEGSPGTVLLPPDNALSNSLGLPLPSQPPSAILFNVLMSGASVLVLVVVAANYDRGGLVILLLAAVPTLASILLWLWPLLKPFKT